MSDARVIRPDRSQTRWDYIDLEALLPSDHRGRIVWSFVESLNLSELSASIKSREGEAGRLATDPAVLLALWLYVTAEGLARRANSIALRSAIWPIAGSLAVCR
jgi:hypothetical protein